MSIIGFILIGLAALRSGKERAMHSQAQNCSRWRLVPAPRNNATSSPGGLSKAEALHRAGRIG